MYLLNFPIKQLWFSIAMLVFRCVRVSEWKYAARIVQTTNLFFSILSEIGSIVSSDAGSSPAVKPSRTRFIRDLWRIVPHFACNFLRDTVTHLGEHIAVCNPSQRLLPVALGVSVKHCNECLDENIHHRSGMDSCSRGLYSETVSPNFAAIGLYLARARWTRCSSASQASRSGTSKFAMIIAAFMCVIMGR